MDDYPRDGLAIEIDISLGGMRAADFVEGEVSRPIDYLSMESDVIYTSGPKLRLRSVS